MESRKGRPAPAAVTWDGNAIGRAALAQCGRQHQTPTHTRPRSGKPKRQRSRFSGDSVLPKPALTRCAAPPACRLTAPRNTSIRAAVSAAAAVAARRRDGRSHVGHCRRRGGGGLLRRSLLRLLRSRLLRSLLRRGLLCRYFLLLARSGLLCRFLLGF